MEESTGNVIKSLAMREITYCLMRLPLDYAENQRRYCILAHSVSRQSTKVSLMAVTSGVSRIFSYT